MGQARAGLAALVDERVHVPRYGGSSPPPGLGDQIGLVVLELRQRTDVTAAVDDDLLPLECRIEIRNDAPRPVAAFGQHERLWWGHLLVPRTERTCLELLGRRRVECRTHRTGSLRATGGDNGDTARLRFAAKLAAQFEP